MDYECWKANAVYESIEDQGRYYGLFPALSHQRRLIILTLCQFLSKNKASFLYGSYAFSISVICLSPISSVIEIC